MNHHSASVVNAYMADPGYGFLRGEENQIPGLQVFAADVSAFKSLAAGDAGKLDTVLGIHRFDE
ncbi:hypothetical protein D3C73_1612570 [compost metagenome]